MNIQENSCAIIFCGLRDLNLYHSTSTRIKSTWIITKTETLSLQLNQEIEVVYDNFCWALSETLSDTDGACLETSGITV